MVGVQRLEEGRGGGVWPGVGVALRESAPRSGRCATCDLRSERNWVECMSLALSQPREGPKTCFRATCGPVVAQPRLRKVLLPAQARHPPLDEVVLPATARYRHPLGAPGGQLPTRRGFPVAQVAQPPPPHRSVLRTRARRLNARFDARACRPQRRRPLSSRTTLATNVHQASTGEGFLQDGFARHLGGTPSTLPSRCPPPPPSARSPTRPPPPAPACPMPPGPSARAC